MKYYPNLAKEILKAYKGIASTPVPKPEIQINFVKDDFYIENEANFFYIDNPFAYLSQQLYKKGPLTGNELWNLYMMDREKGFEYDIIDSKTTLKLRFLKRMINKGHVIKAGYSKIQNRHLGYRVNPKVAFEWIHPQLLLDLNPLPDCDLVNRYGPMREQYLDELETARMKAEIPDEVVVHSETSKKFLVDRSTN